MSCLLTDYCCWTWSSAVWLMKKPQLSAKYVWWMFHLLLIIAVGRDRQQPGLWRNHNCHTGMSGGCFICCWLLLLDVIVNSLADKENTTITWICSIYVLLTAVGHDGNHWWSGWWRNHSCHIGMWNVCLVFWLNIAAHQSSWKEQEWAIIYQTNAETVSKAALRKLLSDGMKHIWAFQSM